MEAGSHSRQECSVQDGSDSRHNLALVWKLQLFDRAVLMAHSHPKWAKNAVSGCLLITIRSQVGSSVEQILLTLSERAVLGRNWPDYNWVFPYISIQQTCLGTPFSCPTPTTFPVPAPLHGVKGLSVVWSLDGGCISILWLVPVGNALFAWVTSKGEWVRNGWHSFHMSIPSY